MIGMQGRSGDDGNSEQTTLEQETSLARKKSGQWKITRLVITSWHRDSTHRYYPSEVMSNGTWKYRHSSAPRVFPPFRSRLWPRAFSLAKGHLHKGSDMLKRKNITKGSSLVSQNSGPGTISSCQTASTCESLSAPPDPTHPSIRTVSIFLPSLVPACPRDSQAGQASSPPKFSKVVIPNNLPRSPSPPHQSSIHPTTFLEPLFPETKIAKNSPNRTHAVFRTTRISKQRRRATFLFFDSNFYTADYKQWPAERESPRAERARAARRGRPRAPRSSRATRRGPVSR